VKVDAGVADALLASGSDCLVDPYAHTSEHSIEVLLPFVQTVFPGVPIVLGGVEASLRRFAHYDYWDDKVRRSLIFDTKADYLTYGMSEKGILAIANTLSSSPSPFPMERGGTSKASDGVRWPNTAIIVKDISA